MGDGYDRDELAFEDIRDGVREATQDVSMGAVFDRDDPLDEFVKAARYIAVAFCVET